MPEVTSIFTVEITDIRTVRLDDLAEIISWIKKDLNVDDVHIKQIQNFPGEEDWTNIIKAEITDIHDEPWTMDGLEEYIRVALLVDKVDIKSLKNFISDGRKNKKAR